MDRFTRNRHYIHGRANLYEPLLPLGMSGGHVPWKRHFFGFHADYVIRSTIVRYVPHIWCPFWLWC